MKYVYIAKVAFTERDLGGFLDMLRYDGCTVRNWQQKDGEFVVGLSNERPFTEPRWASFGLFLHDKEVERR